MLPSELRDAVAPGSEAPVVQHAFITEAHLSIVLAGPRDRGPTAVVKVAQAEEPILALTRHERVLRSLHANDRLVAWSPVLPVVLWSGRQRGTTVLVERFIAGYLATDLVADPGQRVGVMRASLRAISDLHQRTRRMTIVDDRLLEAWVHSPARALAGAGVALDRGGLERIADEVSAVLMGRTLPIGWMHGDFWLGNVLIGQDGSIAGILDWDRATPDGWAVHDLLHLAVSTRLILEGTDVGMTVASILEDPADAIRAMLHDDAAAPDLPDDADALRASVLLYWLRYVSWPPAASNLQSSRWVRRNITTVIEAASATRSGVPFAGR